MTRNEFTRIFPNASPDAVLANCEPDDHRSVPDAEPKRNKAPALDRTDARKEESVQRPTVRFTGYRVRPLDPDNFAGSVKDLLDGLRHSSLVKGDEWWRIRLETAQVKVRSYKEEKTVIEIITEA